MQTATIADKYPMPNSKEFCRNGHLFDEFNTGYKKDGNKLYKACKTCRKNNTINLKQIAKNNFDKNTFEFSSDEIKRFFQKVTKIPGGCWLWTGVTANGYGLVTCRNIQFKVHRASYLIAKGKIEYGLDLDHLCRVRNCVNPDHLEPISHRENVLRGVGLSAINKQKTHCKNGHSFDENNTYILVRNDLPIRHCKTCMHNWKVNHSKKGNKILCA